MADEAFSVINAELEAASSALRHFGQVESRRAADDMAIAFDHAGARISASLARAARDGEVSFKRMAKVILEEMAKVALDRVFSQKSAPFFGARAAGGAVNPGGAYLVGERGPEWFTPHQSGQVGAGPSGAVSVHFHLGAGADANAITRNQGQIAAAIARAVAYGRRNL